MTDRYERIRDALAMGPTPGPWFAVNDGTEDEPMMSVEAARVAGRKPRQGGRRRMARGALAALLFALSLGLPFGVAAREWTTEEKWTGAAALTLSVIDWAQTRHIAKNPDKWRELNPMLPDHPTLGQVNRHFIQGLALTGIVAHFLPDHRLTILRTVAAFQLGVTARNAFIGIRMEF